MLPPRETIASAGVVAIEGVVLDLAPNLGPCWAVVWAGQLLPMRFGEAREAEIHLLHLRYPALAHQKDAAA